MENLESPNKERAFLMMKPDGVVKGLTGEVLKRVERCGLKIVALKMFWATRDQVDGHYPKSDEWLERLGDKTIANYERYGYDLKKELGTENKKEIGLKIRDWLKDYLTSAPMVKMVVEGPHAVDLIRKLVGNTIPSQAEMGTIRGDFSADSAAYANRDKRPIHNVVHASETPEEASHEISFWFEPEDIFTYMKSDEYCFTMANKKQNKK